MNLHSSLRMFATMMAGNDSIFITICAKGGKTKYRLRSVSLCITQMIQHTVALMASGSKLHREYTVLLILSKEAFCPNS